MNKLWMSEQRQSVELFDRLMYDVNTCIPGIVVEFYPDTQTATVRPAIKLRVISEGNADMFEDMPAILQVPICFPFSVGSGFALTTPVTAGDPCVLVFSQRCIENWHELGGLQEPESGSASRHHDMNDAFAFVGAPSLTEVLADWLTDGMEIRNSNRTSRATVREGRVELVAAQSSIQSSSSGHEVAGMVETDSHVSVGTGASGVFVDQLGAVITVQNGIIVGGLD